MPDPVPSHVAGYRQWQQLGRQVSKGQPGYQILAPVTGRFASATPHDDESWRSLGKGEKPRAGETVRTKIVGVRPPYVWDASQTTGDPIPEPPAPRLLEGQAPAGLWEGLATQVAEAGFELRLVADATEMFGAFGLSFTALADLAARSGIGTGQAWAWPLIVDGIIVVATVAIVALAGQKAAWYPWALLIDGAVVSVTANALTWAQDSNKARTETIDDGKGSSLVRGVELAGGLSKLASPVIQMVRAHQSIRARRHGPQRRRRQPRRSPRAFEGLLQRAEAAYAAGGSLKAVAREVGLGHERLARLLRERGVILRNHSPSTSEIRLMRAMYEQGASLERVGDRFGYTAGTVRKHLIIADVTMRHTHCRGTGSKAQQGHH